MFEWLITFNRTTVECKYRISMEIRPAAGTFNRTTVECKLSKVLGTKQQRLDF